MILELDYETVSALESALLLAEITRARDAKAWRTVAYSQGVSEQSREAKELAAFFRRQTTRYRTAMDALQKAQRKAYMSDYKFPIACGFVQEKGRRCCNTKRPKEKS